MAKEKYHNNQEITAISQEKNNLQASAQSDYTYIYIYIDWSGTRMLGNGISTDSTKIWKHGWYKQKRGDSQLVICVFVSESNTYFSFHLKLFMLLS